MSSHSDADFERDYNIAVQPHMLQTDELPPGTLLNQEYEIIETLGTGGMGTVYLARDAQLKHKLLAIKILLADKPKADADHFIQEAQRASKVKSPHVVEIHSFRTAKAGDPMQLTYMVMEYIGKNLETYAEELGGKLNVRTALRFSMQACAALHAAHSAGVVHRDIKPLNCLIRVRETDEGEKIEELVVTDFGIAREVRQSREPSVNEHWTVIGTEGYIAPEILLREPNPDARVDIYGVGAMLFRLLTGQPPPLFPKPKDFESRDIPEQIVPILQKALAQSPKERYGSARALKSALSAVESALWGAPIPIHPSVAPAPPSVGDRAKSAPPTVAKGRGSLVVTLFWLLAVGLAVSAWQLMSDDDRTRVAASPAPEREPVRPQHVEPSSPPAVQPTPSFPKTTPLPDQNKPAPTSPETSGPIAPTVPEPRPGTVKPRTKPLSTGTPPTSTAATPPEVPDELPKFADKKADFRKLLVFCDSSAELPCGERLTPTLKNEYPKGTFQPKLLFNFKAQSKNPTVDWRGVRQDITKEPDFKACVEQELRSKKGFTPTSDGGIIDCNVVY
jgi:serine/threonine-protein kinase